MTGGRQVQKGGLKKPPYSLGDQMTKKSPWPIVFTAGFVTVAMWILACGPAPWAS
jgi:hypothetical protein